MIESMQQQVVRIGKDVFGVENMSNPQERLLRFFEEAVELVRAGGLSLEQVNAVIAYEMSRPAGDVLRELGGCGVTLYALADAFVVDQDQAVRQEIARVEANKEACQRHHAEKPADVKATTEQGR